MDDAVLERLTHIVTCKKNVDILFAVNSKYYVQF
jgi:hypothetical protein